MRYLLATVWLFWLVPCVQTTGWLGQGTGRNILWHEKINDNPSVSPCINYRKRNLVCLPFAVVQILFIENVMWNHFFFSEWLDWSDFHNQEQYAFSFCLSVPLSISLSVCLSRLCMLLGWNPRPHTCYAILYHWDILSVWFYFRKLKMKNRKGFLFRVGLCVDFLFLVLIFFSGLNLYRSWVCCHSLCGFICASVHLCLEDTVSFETYTTSDYYIFFLLPLLHRFLSIEWKGMINFPFRTEYSTVFHTLHISQKERTWKLGGYEDGEDVWVVGGEKIIWSRYKICKKLNKS